MTMIQEPPVVVVPPAPSPASPGPGPPTRQRTSWTWMVAASAVIIFGLVGALVWVMASTVPTSDYDRATADLASAQTEIETLTADNGELTARNAAVTADLESLQASHDKLVSEAAAAAIAAQAIAYLDLNNDAAFVQQVVQSGWNATTADELLAQLGEDVTLEEWVNSGSAFLAADRSVYLTEDATLIDAWNTWLVTEPGSLEEAAAYGDVLFRLAYLINEPLSVVDEPSAPPLVGLGQ